jgi:DNA primase
MTVDTRTLLDRVAAIYRARLWAMGAAPGTPLTYLHQRGFADGTIRLARLGYCAGDEILKYLRQNRIPLDLARSLCLIDPERGDCEFLRGRIVFPDFSSDDHVLGLAGRKWAGALGPRSAKHLALKGWDKPLYGWARLDKDACDQPVFVTESLPDGLSLNQWGLDALVTLGTALKPPHARLLADLLRPLVYVPHNDGGTGLAAAQAWRAAVGRGEILRLPGQAKDINELALIPGGRRAFATAYAELVHPALASM